MKSRKLFTQGLLADAQELLDNGQIQDAGIVYSRIAGEYQRYLADYPSVDDNERSNIMLLTANNYESAGNLAQANIIYRDYVDRYPDRQEARLYLLPLLIIKMHLSMKKPSSIMRSFTIRRMQKGRGCCFSFAQCCLTKSRSWTI